MIRGFEIFAVFVFALCAVPGSTKNVSVECMISYDKGGVRAVLESSECPKWVPSQDDKQNCQFAILQGRRKYQEDRVTCNLDMKIPYLDKEVIIGIAAIFDGHGGKEASELASKKFLDYFTLNVQFNIYKSKLENEKADISTLERSLPEINDKSLHDIIEKALVTTYQDIDSEFSVEALNKGYISGSTGTVVLLLNGQLLIGYVGDSKALLCRGKTHSDHMREIYAEELTKDHHPDRDDEKARIEAAGGSVKIWGVPRVNGILAVSRAIGDVNLKRYGVIAEPEIVGWRYFQVDDSYLVIASDGIFEGITPQNVCDIIKSRYNEEKEASKGLFSRPFSLADWIVESAFKNGSTDNLSAIVIPLRPTSSSPQNHEEAIDKVEL